LTYFFSKTVTDNPFSLKTSGDISLIILWILSGIVPLIFLFKKRNKSVVITVTIFFAIGAWLSSLIGLLLNPKGHLTLALTKRMILATKTTYLITAILMVITFFVAIKFLLPKIKDNNWILFLNAVPYIIFSWYLESSFHGFWGMISDDNFSVKQLYWMLVIYKANLNLINEMVFRLMTISIIGLFCIAGILVYEIIWTKTKEWRIK
jgi:hypothetical protein